MPFPVEEAIARIPQWANARDVKTSFLAGGITNQNFKVEVDGEAYVLRIVGANTELLGVNRHSEYIANQAAGKMGIAPEVIYFIEPEQCLVTRFIEARSISFEEIGQPKNIRRIVEALKKIHALPPVDHEFSPFRIFEQGAEVARQHNVELPANIDWLMERKREIEAAIWKNPVTLRLCHNDLLNANFLVDDSDHLYILDWEYAGMNDPFFDLANFSTNHEFSDEQDRLILESYFGEVKPADWAHLKLMRIMSDYRESMWGLVQVGISELDFDFRAYADKHFARLEKSLNDPQYELWLRDVQLAHT